MNIEFIKNQKGQVNMIAPAIGIIVLFVLISLGLNITNNFYAATGQTPPLSTLWALTVAGVGILVLVVGLLRLFT